MVIASHKTGSSLLGRMTRAACAAAGFHGNAVVDDQLMRALKPAPPGHAVCARMAHCFFCNDFTSCAKASAARTCPDEVSGRGKRASCCWLREFTWEQPQDSNVNFRALFMLRDPINFIVSHYWFHFDGHERPKPHEAYERARSGRPLNKTRGLLNEMMPGSYGSAVQILGVVNQLVRRNSPDKAKIMCLEDVMESEEAFVDIWVRAFQFLGLPIDAQTVRYDKAFYENNPASSRASKHTIEHGTSQHNEEKLGDARRVLKLDAEASRAYRGSTIFTTYRNLSASVNCFDWKTESRGDQKDAWMLRWW